ncbi:hypothetical protein, partial [Streptomyces sp. PU-14G]|uniref:hypothetical protein n=1 Tax=Streptomyces sp. PU-14G TaxID=2800808 RepID=UPI0034DE766F
GVGGETVSNHSPYGHKSRHGLLGTICPVSVVFVSDVTPGLPRVASGIASERQEACAQGHFEEIGAHPDFTLRK